MNKYSSGYALIQIISLFGWIIIALSVIGGVFFASNASSDMTLYGFGFAIVGSFQGLLLLGVGAIGTAILDGSIAQQDSLRAIQDIRRAVSSENFESNNVDTVSVSPVLGDISNGEVLKKDEIRGNTGRIYDLYFMNDGKVRVKKGAGFLEFDTIEAANEHFSSNW